MILGASVHPVGQIAVGTGPDWPSAALEALRSIDLTLLYFFNSTLQNRIFDGVMPALTDYIKQPVGLAAAIALWLWLLVAGGRKGRLAALLVVPTIALTDNFNSDVLKSLFDRPRPCHTLSNLHLLVRCGGGYSFPSTHAVNNFAWTMLLWRCLPRRVWSFCALFGFATLISFSRVYVGVHYPSDVLAGAIVGLACGAAVAWLHGRLEAWWRRRRSRDERRGPSQPPEPEGTPASSAFSGEEGLAPAPARGPGGGR